MNQCILCSQGAVHLLGEMNFLKIQQSYQTQLDHLQEVDGLTKGAWGTLDNFEEELTFDYILAFQ